VIGSNPPGSVEASCCTWTRHDFEVDTAWAGLAGSAPASPAVAVVMIPTAKDMISSLLHPKPAVRRIDSPLETPSPDPARREYLERRHATADFTEGEEDEEEDGDEHDGDQFNPNHQSIRFVDQGLLRGNVKHNLLIPLFSASHLGSNF